MSPRARTVLIVVALAVLAAVVVAGASVISSDERDSGAATTVPPKPRKGAPPLELSLGVRDDAEARGLQRAIQLYEAGRRSEAGAIFGRYDSLEAKLGAAFAAWPGTEDRSSSSRRSTRAARSSSCTSGWRCLWAGKAARARPGASRARSSRTRRTPSVRTTSSIPTPAGVPVFTPSFPYSRPWRPRGCRAEDAPRRPCGVRWSTASRCSGSADRSPRGVRLSGAAAGAGRPDALVAAAVVRFEKSDPAGAFAASARWTSRFPRVGERPFSPRRPPALAGRCRRRRSVSCGSLARPSLDSRIAARGRAVAAASSERRDRLSERWV